MATKMEVLAIIPARGGSKRVPHKNIKLLGGKPLISYAIRAARKSKYVSKIIVSTDDEKIAKIAKKYKAEIPFIRPARLAGDTSTTLSVLQHALLFLEKENKYKPDLVVLLQPTSPFVLSSDIDEAIEKLIKTRMNSCVSVCEIVERPEWMFTYQKDKKDKIKPYLKNFDKTTTSQKMPKIFRLNGAIYVNRRDVLMNKNKIIDNNCAAIVMPINRSIDIDTMFDFLIAETLIKNNHAKEN